MQFQYKVFENYINSDIEIDILKKCDTSFHKDIINISRDDSLLDKLVGFKKRANNYYKINLDKSQIYINDIALFNISNSGFSISYILQAKADMPSFFSKLLNHVVPYALYMQKKFLLHASGVAFNDGGFIFLGRSGAGKSSLAASLKDMHFACEDSALIKSISNELFLMPSFNLVKLNSKIYKDLKLNNRKVANIKVDKLNRNLYEVKNFLDHKVRLKRCYILEWGNNFKIEKVNKKNIFGTLYSSIFGPHPISSCKESELIIYQKITSLLKSVEFYKLYRNKSDLFSNNQSIIRHMKT